MRRWCAIIMAMAVAALFAGRAQACIAPPHLLTAMPETAVVEEFDGTRAGIWGAWFDGPTERYGHGVLGDGIEATILSAYSAFSANLCQTVSVVLDRDHVFEDVAPRLADLDGDGVNEIIVVRSHRRLGAQLAIYGDARDGSSLRLIATTPYIGQANRWLAPIGAADLDGDGRVEIAYIDRPHLARILRIWRFVPDGQGGGELEELASMGGLTNHRIGEDFISGGIRDCGQGPEMITATTDWSRLIASRFDGQQITTRDLGPYSAAALQAAQACR
jgi:VCBS repeat protein